MCVGRVIYKECNFVCRNIHTNDTKVKQKRDLVFSLKKHVYNIIHFAQCETSQPLSLTEIVHRQSKYGHLSIVDDRLFQLFKEFDNHLHLHLNINTMCFNDDKFFDALLSNTLHDVMAETDVCRSCPDFSSSLLWPVFAKYLHVCLKEPGIRITNTLNIKKKVSSQETSFIRWMYCAKTHENRYPTNYGPRTLTSPSTVNDCWRCNHSCWMYCISFSWYWFTIYNSSDFQWGISLCYCKGPYVGNRFNWIEYSIFQQWLHRKCDSTLKAQKRWKAVMADGAVDHCPQCRKGE